MTVSKGRLLEMKNWVARLPNVCCMYDPSRLTDAVTIAKFKSREELGRFTKELLATPCVERAKTHVVLAIIKEDFSARYALNKGRDRKAPSILRRRSKI